MDADLSREKAAELREQLEYGWSTGIKRGWKAVFLSRLDAALHGSEEELRHVNTSLAEIFNVWTGEVEIELKALATGSSAHVEENSSLRQALLLGQLMVAQGLASQALRCRADAPMLAALIRYKKYLLPLKVSELSNKALADVYGETTAHVTRQLSEMRRAGLVDFRKESKNTINFLTSLAKELLANEPIHEKKTIISESVRDEEFSIFEMINAVKSPHSRRQVNAVAPVRGISSSKPYMSHPRFSSSERAVHKIHRELPDSFQTLPTFTLKKSPDYASR